MVFAAMLHPATVAAHEKWANFEPFSATGRQREIREIALDGQGNLYLAGAAGVPGGSYDFMTARYSGTTGARQWIKTAGHKAKMLDVAQSIAVDAAGNAVSGGFFTTKSSGLNKDFQTVKYTATGALKWSKPLAGKLGADDMIHCVAMDPSGDSVVLGETRGISFSSKELTLVKYSSAKGAILWRKDLPDSGFARKLLIDAAGNPIVINIGPVRIVKFSGANGTVLWDKSIPPESTNLQSVGDAVLDGQGNIVLVGSSDPMPSYRGVCTIKLAAADGAVQWERVFRGPNSDHDRAVGIGADAGGDVIIAIKTWTRDDNIEFRTIKYAGAGGSELWTARAGPSGYQAGHAEPMALALTPGGDAIVTGIIHTAKNGSDLMNSDPDLYTVIHSGRGGHLFWEERWAHPAGGHETPISKGVKVAPSGNFVIAGHVTNVTDNGTFAVAYPAVSPPPPGQLILAEAGADWPPVPLPQGAVVDFGTHFSSGTPSKYFRLASIGPGAVEQLKVEILGGNLMEFYTSPLPAYIAPDHAVSFNLNFRPKMVYPPDGEPYVSGPRSALLRISAHGIAPLEIPLAGVVTTRRGVFDRWAAEQLLAGDEARPDATPHDDGVANLLKFAFNMDATRPDRHVLVPGGNSGLPSCRVVGIGGTDHLEIEFPRRRDNVVNYTVKISTTLAPGSFQFTPGWTVNDSEIDASWSRATFRRPLQAGMPRLYAVIEVQLLP